MTDKESNIILSAEGYNAIQNKYKEVMHDYINEKIAKNFGGN